MIKINLGDIETIFNGFKVLIEKEIPIKIAYKLMKLLKQLEDENKFFIDKRNELLKKYSQKDDNGNIKQIDEGNGKVGIQLEIDKIEEFNNKLKDLVDIEISIDFEKVKIEELGDIKITIKDLYNLDKFIII